MVTRWYETLFSGIVLDMWRSAVTPEQTRREADFLQQQLRRSPGARVLDVPCGLGRHAIELAGRGFRVTGVDLSKEAIAEARRTAAERGLEAEWLHADMRDLPPGGDFDGGYCFGNSFGYLDPEGTRAFVRAVAAALRPGGRFVLDYGLAAELVLPRLREREWAQFDDVLFLEENRYHAAESCVETAYTFIRGGKAETRTGLQWVYTVRELRELFASAGLTVEGLFGSIDLDPFRLGSPGLLLVASKN
jgi:SAM-dependent methyltransferase